MEFKLVLAISQRTYSSSYTVLKSDGVSINGGGVARNMTEWLDFIATTDGGDITYLEEEFTFFEPKNTFEVTDKYLAEMIGVIADVVYPVVNFYFPKWGNSVLILQNAANISPNPNSMITKFEEVPIEFENDNTILRGFAPISDYEIENDRENYSIDVKMFPGGKKTWVKEFFTNNIGETINIKGFSFKISESENVNLDMSIYRGIKDQYSNRNLKEFSVGFIKEV